MQVVVTHNPPNWKCPCCGVAAFVPSFPVHCRCGFTQLNPQIGLGDMAAAALHRLGITQTRYLRVKSALGLKRKCGCRKRQAALNRLGRKLGL